MSAAFVAHAWRVPLSICSPCTPTREPTKHVYYSMTKSLCRTCKRSVDAKIRFRDGAVWFDKFCPEHGHQECLVASSVEWYLDALSFIAPSTPPPGKTRAVEKGCPFDCGPCRSHQQKVFMPVVPITSACNLDCPICYTVNKNAEPHRLSKEQFAATLTHLTRAGDDLDIINFTGGEPTLHPDLPLFLQMARRAGYERLTVSTNGLKLLDEEYVKILAEVDARIVLSFDTFDEAVDRAMLGATTVKSKLRVLDLLEKHDVTTTLLPAVAKGLNDKDVGPLLELCLTRKNLCSLELHTLTFTGQGGVTFDRDARITTPDLHALIAAATQDQIVWRDFVPSPLAHPHCYSICYLLMLDGGGYVPFTRFMSRARLFDLLGDSIYIEPGERVEEALRESIDDLWASDADIPHKEGILATLKRLIGDLFPPEGIHPAASGPGSRERSPLEIRRRIAERASRAIYIHSHMDEESFDVARIMKCSIGVPESDGSNIPTCAYNVLYREHDPRFADPEMLARMARGRGLGNQDDAPQEGAPRPRSLPIVR